MSPITVAAAGSTATLTNGFQYTLLTRGDDIRRKPGIQIRDVLNNTPNTCSFTVDGKSNTPQSGEEIQIVDAQDGNRLLFAGTVQLVDQEYDGVPGSPGGLNWKVTATDFTWLLNKMVPFGTYTDVSATDIVKDLIAKFAPGFTSTYVQTNLAHVTISFDGSMDMATALSKIATAIGGGHWYVDYNRSVHFFHTIPSGVIIPSQPTSNLKLGPGSTMTAARGAVLPTTYSYSPGIYFFRSVFIYDNGAVSAASPITDPTYLDGHHYLNLSAIPIGPVVGSHSCVKRRIYEKSFGSSNNWSPIFDITDNTTTSVVTFGGQQSVSPIDYLASYNPSLPAQRYVSPPVGPSTAVSMSQGTGLLQSPPPELEYNHHIQLTMSGGIRSVKVAFLYRDGTISLPGPASVGVYLDGVHTIQFNTIPTGPTINNVDVVARLLYESYGGSKFDFYARYIVPGNTSTTFTFYGGDPGYNFRSPSLYQFGAIPIWPNPDGPSLETFDPPDALTDTNRLLLNDPQFTVSTDLSQVRNRIYIRGASSTVVWSSDTAKAAADAIIAAATAAGVQPVLPPAALAGSSTVYVNDIGAFTPFGGTIQISGRSYQFDGVTGTTGSGAIYISSNTPITDDIAYGAVVVNTFVADDVDSQQALAKVELDVNGNPTDGIHEFTIVDGSLVTYIQMYMRAYAELELFGRPIVTIKYSTRDPNSRSGAIVHANLKHPPCYGDFLIQDVTIDQIHDEADVLMPRYNVTASSVKFNLNDLLLQLTSGTTTGSSGGAPTGMVSSTSNGAVVPPAIPNTALTGKRWQSRARLHDGTLADLGNIGNSWSTTGSSSDIQDQYPGIGGLSSHWERFIPVNLNANLCGYNLASAHPAGWCYWEHQPKFAAMVRSSPNLSDYTLPNKMVYWFGIGNTEPTAGSSVLLKPHVCIICDGPGAASGTWQASTGTDGGQTISTIPGILMLPNTVYFLTVEWVSATQAKVTITDVTRTNTVAMIIQVASLQSTQISGASVGMKGWCYGTGTPNLASTSFLDIGAIYAESY